MENQIENQYNQSYIHVGIGIPGFRSYSLGICKTFTSSCIHNYRLRKWYRVYTASHVNYVFKKFLNALDVLQKPFHMYKSRDRTYYVYKYEHNLMLLIEHIFNLSELIHKNRTLMDKRSEIVNSIIYRCRDVETCLDAIVKTIIEAKEKIERARERGKKALLTRFERNTRKCESIVKKYFSDLYNYHVFDAYSVLYDVCMEKAISVLTKFFDEERSRRYSDRICRGNDSIYLFAHDGIFAIKTSNSAEHFKLFFDSCVDNEKYAIVKLVGVSLVDSYIDRIDWIAVLGLDKATNQVFLHYVPKTLVLRDVETCRKWILGIVDEYGNPFEDVEVVEV